MSQLPLVLIGPGGDFVESFEARGSRLVSRPCWQPADEIEPDIALRRAPRNMRTLRPWGMRLVQAFMGWLMSESPAKRARTLDNASATPEQSRALLNRASLARLARSTMTTQETPPSAEAMSKAVSAVVSKVNVEPLRGDSRPLSVAAPSLDPAAKQNGSESTRITAASPRKTEHSLEHSPATTSLTELYPILRSSSVAGLRVQDLKIAPEQHNEPDTETVGSACENTGREADARLLTDHAGTGRRSWYQQSHGLRARRSTHSKGRLDPIEAQGSLFAHQS